MLRLLGSRSPALSSTSALFLSFQIQRTAGTVRTCRWTEVGTLSPIYHLSPSRQLSSLMGVSLMRPGLQFEQNLALVTNLCIRTMEMNFFAKPALLNSCTWRRSQPPHAATEASHELAFLFLLNVGVPGKNAPRETSSVPVLPFPRTQRTHKARPCWDTADKRVSWEQQ